jgi:hypothetical protein
MSALDKLKKLNAGLTTETKKKDTRERPELPVPPAVKLAFTRLIPAQRIAKVAEERIKIENALVSDEMMGVYAETLFSQGSRPTNPRISLDKDGRPDISGLFQVQERFKIQVEDGPAELRDRLISSFRKAGLSAEVAENLVEKEIAYTPTTTLKKPLNELAEGTDVEKSAADKIISLCIGESAAPLTPAEKEAALAQYDIATVRDGFLERVRAYVTSALQLRMVFKVVTPVHFVSHGKFAESDTPEEQVKRLAEEAAKLVIGTPLKK